ncbi:MAG: 50S ribosomal protein L29 [Candidatus Yanofskybacteria bacterium GW2011_GWA1_44_21]|uniref:Large ribosomal subunit protein uL29 n=2 Tax=Candidatus Yanofskyibacteriota TaxID=1752733 RepID=A0A1F8H3H8_9BACT|nr:MAG: 50S ribosomal protein L29 [Candidatus Yanofskybacteria bacterium GW2011_GWA2_44_10]KKT50696.1 MAG: 50S ribosomal protein L29 [Candidatus Yanofskybacteria bacterium GW2011_GWA1_44_21]KKT90224.1 MAG: 50S ribosomal protein L29 [Candidatus Yanofskybacteria bacterium GW2011_GWB1_45_11]OGN02215.1 MAG: 50S ribosomal protein L29 [Candidatus Yanofskybacteria bacterium RIFCSPHIGHO2_01_FULL_44_110b]OGN14841.1 MAG: 50S ribosomal protein L29 [Candidatus Yanofskybacteria bacterium RIFCSPHIGHO2_02_FUL
MKYTDLENKSAQELKNMLEETKAMMLQLRFDLANKKLNDVSRLKKTKTSIAQILTKIKEHAGK